MRVALLGTGTMGAGMARSLHRAGLDVAAWNRTRSKAEPLADDGIDGGRLGGRRRRRAPTSCSRCSSTLDARARDRRRADRRARPRRGLAAVARPSAPTASPASPSGSAHDPAARRAGARHASSRPRTASSSRSCPGPTELDRAGPARCSTRSAPRRSSPATSSGRPARSSCLQRLDRCRSPRRPRSRSRWPSASGVDPELFLRGHRRRRRRTAPTRSSRARRCWRATSRRRSGSTAGARTSA